MSKQTAIRLDDSIHARLQILASETGRTISYYMREAIETHLEELEDVYLAEKSLESLRKGTDKIYTLEQVEHELGLDS